MIYPSKKYFCDSLLALLIKQTFIEFSFFKYEIYIKVVQENKGQSNILNDFSDKNILGENMQYQIGLIIIYHFKNNFRRLVTKIKLKIFIIIFREIIEITFFKNEIQI